MRRVGQEIHFQSRRFYSRDWNPAINNYGYAQYQRRDKFCIGQSDLPILSHHRSDSGAKEGIGLSMQAREVAMAMQDVRRYRAMGQLCRQQAVLHPQDGWKWLAQAARWEDLAEAEIAATFEECNAAASECNDLTQPNNAAAA